MQHLRIIKETLSVISIDTSCKDGYLQFTTVPLKPVSDRSSITKILMFIILKLINFNCEIIRIEIIPRKQQYLTYIDKIKV